MILYDKAAADALQKELAGKTIVRVEYLLPGVINIVTERRSGDRRRVTNTPVMVPDTRLNKLLDDILRQVVCCCGGYRHHGVEWMPEGSGEGKSVAKTIVMRFLHDVKNTQ
jgi:hypothetical protein